MSTGEPEKSQLLTICHFSGPILGIDLHKDKCYTFKESIMLSLEKS